MYGVYINNKQQVDRFPDLPAVDKLNIYIQYTCNISDHHQKNINEHINVDLC